MDIVLAYVVGINRIDTPYFQTAQQQANWFDTKIVRTISTTFYPPHYQNKIRVTADDLDIKTNCNYLWLIYNSKRYYYFIDDVTYINESLIELDITMDYIQTYFFNIKINNGIIERKSIDRWFRNLGTPPRFYANRNYIRENVGNSDFRFKDGQVLDTDLWLIIKFSRISDYNGTAQQGNYDEYASLINVDSNRISLPYIFAFVPLNQAYTEIVFKRYADRTSTTVNFNDFKDTLNRIVYYAKNESILDMYIVPFNPLPSAFEIANNTVIVNTDQLIEDPDDSALHNYWYIKERILIPIVTELVDGLYKHTYQDLTLSLNTKVFDLPFLVNSIKGTSFNPYYESVLMDENYLRVVMGSNNAPISIPLYEQLYKRCQLYIGCDISSGCRIYGTYPNNGNSEYNYRDLFTIDNNILGVDMMNDAWEQYIANNRNRWVSAGFSTVGNIAETMISVALGNFGIEKEISSMLANPRSYTKKRKQLKAGIGRAISSKRVEQETNVLEGLTNFSAFSPLFNQAIQDSNIKYVPDTLKQAGNIMGPTLAKNIECFYSYQEVSNFTQCAWYFHRNGYKVDEYVSNISNIFDYIQNRYYFNIVKMARVELYLDGVLGDNETIENIKDRFIDGLRIWSVVNNDVTMGDFQYDNVELSYFPI